MLIEQWIKGDKLWQLVEKSYLQFIFKIGIFLTYKNIFCGMN